MQRRWVVAALLAFLGGCRRETSEAPPPGPAPPCIRLMAGGDVMLSRHVGRMARLRRDALLPFRGIAPRFQAADLAFVNLESPFSNRGPVRDTGMIFRADPALIQGLTHAGIDVVSLANNHARDCGRYGLEYTLELLGEHSVAAAGAGLTPEQARQGVVLEAKGVRFGFLAYTYDSNNGNWPDPDDRIALLNPKEAAEDVRRLLRQADAVVVSMHAGAEYSAEPNPDQRQFAHTVIDAGCALVLGHHPHVVQPVEIYGGGVIFYSLGNLVFDQFHRAETQRGAVAEIEFEGARPARYRMHSVVVDSRGARFAGDPQRWVELMPPADSSSQTRTR